MHGNVPQVPDRADPVSTGGLVHRPERCRKGACDGSASMRRRGWMVTVIRFDRCCCDSIAGPLLRGPAADGE